MLASVLLYVLYVCFIMCVHEFIVFADVHMVLLL